MHFAIAPVPSRTIVRDLYTVRVAILPAKTYAPLVNNECSHIAPQALCLSAFSPPFSRQDEDGATDGRGHDFGGDVKVPDRGATACSELGHELRNIIEFRGGLYLELESARDAREVAIAEC